MLNWPKLALSLLDVDSVPHTEVLDALARGIRSAEDIATRAAQADESYEAQWAIDEQCENIEVFLGIAYITLQTRISYVVSRAIGVCESLSQSTPAGDLMALGKTTKGFSQIEILWALANYFKHRDEWPGDWSGKKNANTVKVIQAIGLAPGSTGNLRTGAEALGLGTKKVPYSALERLNNIVQTWASHIHKTLDAEVKKYVPPPTRPPTKPGAKASR